MEWFTVLLSIVVIGVVSLFFRSKAVYLELDELKQENKKLKEELKDVLKSTQPIIGDLNIQTKPPTKKNEFGIQEEDEPSDGDMGATNKSGIEVPLSFFSYLRSQLLSIQNNFLLQNANQIIDENEEDGKGRDEKRKLNIAQISNQLLLQLEEFTR